MVHSPRGPMSQQDHIANLNSTSPLTFPDALSAEDLARDLDLFTNTQFFDFDFGDTSPQFTSSLDPAHPRSSEHGGDSVSGFTFLSGAEPRLDPLNFDLNALSTPSDDSSEPASKQAKASVDALKTEDEIPGTPDEATRVAAEEDKRRRNTLASARFRAKKKLREQALEKDHKEMAAKIDKLEVRIKELELENKWLRGLVVQGKRTASP